MAENERNPKAQLSQRVPDLVSSPSLWQNEAPKPFSLCFPNLMMPRLTKFDILAIDMLVKLVWKCLGDQIWSASFG